MPNTRCGIASVDIVWNPHLREIGFRRSTRLFALPHETREQTHILIVFRLIITVFAHYEGELWLLVASLHCCAVLNRLDPAATINEQLYSDWFTSLSFKCNSVI